MVAPIVYTPEIVKMISERYTAEGNACVPVLAKELNVTKRSVIAKLSNLQIYKKPPYKTKAGEIPVPKAAYIDSIALELGIDVSILDSLEKVTKQALVLMDKKIKLLKTTE
jgi:hypothetical protein